MTRGDLGARARVGGGAELEQLADAFNQLASTLAREDEVRRAAAADIAHELRTPVAGIVSRIEAAQDGVMDDEAREPRGDARRGAAARGADRRRRQARRGRAPRPRCSRARRSTSPTTCRRRAAMYEGFFAAKGIAFTTHAEPTPMQGDGRRLEQVVDNLLSNALRYTDPGGTGRAARAQRRRRAASSRSATPASASAPRTSRTSSTASGAATARARGRRAARASASPSCGSSSGRTTGGSSCAPSSAAARPRGSSCPRASRRSGRRCAPCPPGPDRGGAPPAGRGRGLGSAPR